MNNRIHNSGNPYQGSAKRVLCVCSAGLLRSPTTAAVLQQEYGYNTRAAGIIEDFALIPVDEVLISWAQEIVCMDEHQKSMIINLANSHIKKGVAITIPPIIVLNIPDNFGYMDKLLQEHILKAYKDG